MNIKIGDKVRIKTEEELLAEGYKHTINTDFMHKGEQVVFCYKLGHVGQIIAIEDDDVFIDSDFWVNKSELAEVVPQTLDDYICSLPLEEKAKYFISYSGCSNWWSTITKMDYNGYKKALYATIEALESPKEEEKCQNTK